MADPIATPAPPPHASSPSTSPALDRIEQALARIDAAAKARAADTTALERRHAVLRERMGEAVAALDTILAKERDA